MDTVADRTFWLSWRKGLTDRFFPAPKWLPRLYHKPPYWYGFRFTLAAQQTLEARQSARHNCWVVSVSGVTHQNGSFQVRIRSIRGLSTYFSQVFVDQGNALGKGAERFMFRTPKRLKKGDTIVVEVKNVSTGALTAEVVLEAIEDVNQSFGTL